MDINHLASLARLGLTEEEKKKFSADLVAVLDFFRALEEVNVADIQPISQVSGLENVIREDKIEKCPENVRENILRQAPEIKDGFIKVKKILE